MSTKPSIEETIETQYNQAIAKQKGSRLPGIAVIIAGIGLLIINYLFKIQTPGFVEPLLLLSGSGGIVTGVFLFVFSKKAYVCTENNQKLKTYEVYFDGKERDKLVRIMETGRFNELKSVNTCIHDGLKLRVMKTKDSNVCFSQVVTYIPYEYVNVTLPYKHNPTDAAVLAESLNLK